MNFVVRITVCYIIFAAFIAGQKDENWREKLLFSKVDRTKTMISNVTEQKGMVFCAGDSMISYIQRTIFQVRHVWNSSLHFAVAHCSEISFQNQLKIKETDPYVHIIDVCHVDEHNLILGMSIAYARKRMRSFYCKIGALVKSPFVETMIVDLDVIWFDKPDSLFDYVGYKNTGALYFRDRVFEFTDKTKDRASADDYMSVFYQYNINATKDFIKEKYAQHGKHLFWRYMIGEEPKIPFLGEYAESSVIVFNKANHPRTLALLEKLIPVTVGYGDKELFWIATTIANESYVFEPFLAGQYGDCFGLVLHFNPNDYVHATGQQSTTNTGVVRPMFMNAEYMVEFESLNEVGSAILDYITVPILVTDTTVIADSKTFVVNHATGRCTCDVVSCHFIANYTQYGNIQHQIIMMQWFTLVARLGVSTYANETHKIDNKHTQILKLLYPGTKLPSHILHTNMSLHNYAYYERLIYCVPVLVSYTSILYPVLEYLVSHHYCAFVGCPYVPFRIDTSLDWNLYGSLTEYCDPVSFYVPQYQSSVTTVGSKSNKTTDHLKSNDVSIEYYRREQSLLQRLSKDARNPHSTWNLKYFIPDQQLIACGNSRAVYMNVNNTFHKFASFQVFVRMGKDFDNVKRLTDRRCSGLVFGDDLQ